MNESKRRTEVATLAGGCFWCIEAAMRLVRGVMEAESGYTGGHVPNPTYEQVCSGRTGHAEAVQITFDPDVVSYGELLDLFFAIHDPTQLNRQGPDVGTQYRSAIFYHSPEQARLAEAAIAQLGPEHKSPIVTQVEPLEAFYPAEAYHQRYFEKHPNQPYCRAVVSPKVNKARKLLGIKLGNAPP